MARRDVQPHQRTQGTNSPRTNPNNLVRDAACGLALLAPQEGVDATSVVFDGTPRFARFQREIAGPVVGRANVPGSGIVRLGLKPLKAFFEVARPNTPPGGGGGAEQTR